MTVKWMNASLIVAAMKRNVVVGIALLALAAPQLAVAASVENKKRPSRTPTGAVTSSPVSTETPASTSTSTPTPTPRGPSAYERMMEKEKADFQAWDKCEKRLYKEMDAWARRSQQAAFESGLKHETDGSTEARAKKEFQELVHRCDSEKVLHDQDKFWLTSNDPPAGVEPFKEPTPSPTRTPTVKR